MHKILQRLDYKMNFERQIKHQNGHKIWMEIGIIKTLP